MGDVNLGTVSAKLEFDATEVEKGAEDISRALKLTQEQIVALANATEDQRVKMMAAFESEAKGAEQVAQSVVRWTEAQQRAAMSMSGTHDAANKLNAEYDKQSSVLEGLTSKYGLIIGAITAFAGAVLAVGKAYADSVGAIADYSEKVEKSVLATGLAANTIQSLEKASTAAGISSDGLLRSIQRLEIAAGNDSKAFKGLGLSLEEVRAASPDELFEKVMQKLIPMADIAERNALAQKLLGKSFADAAAGYKEYEENASSYINLTTEQLAAGKELDSNIDALKTAWGELGKEIGAALNTPEIREGVKALAGAIRDMVIAVRDGEGPIAFFFKMISTAAGTAARDIVFLSGALQGLKDRMASSDKDTPGVIAAGMKALDEFDAKANATGLKDLGNKLFPNLGSDLDAIHKKFNPSEGPDRSKEIEAEKKRQETIANLLQRARTSAAIEGKKIMDAQFKEAEKHVKDKIKLDANAAVEERRLAKENQDAIAAINRSHTDMLQQQLRDGTLSVHQEYDIRRDIIRAHGQEEIDQLLKRRAFATDPAVIAAIDKEIGKWGDLTDAEVKATYGLESYIKVQKGLSDLAATLANISNIFQALGGSADSTFGKIVGGLQGVIGGLQNAAGMLNKLGGDKGIGAGFSKMFSDLSGKGGFSGVLEGLSSASALVSTGIGIVKSIVGIFHKPEYKKIMNDVGKSWGVSISEGLAKEIEAISKSTGISRSLAELLDVSKIIGESGKDPREFTGKINDLMNAIASGSVPAAQGLAELGRAFNQVADAALKSGNIGDKALVGLIKRARELGEVTPEMKQFIGGQLDSAVEGVKKLLEVMPADTAAKAGSSGALLAATFNAIAAEQGIVAASAALGPAYDSLMGQITKAGLAIPTALQAIGRQVELGKNKEFQAASGAAAATSQVLSGLGNAGYMDTGILTASADVAKQTFDQAKNAGATDKEAYQAIGGLLSDIKNASVQSGQEISGLAQELISGAQAEGVIIQGNQLSVLVDIRNILAGGGYTPSGVGVGGGTGASGTGGGFGGQGSESGGVTGRAADVFTAPPSVPYRERELRHFQGGSHGVQDFGAGTLALLHGREAVHTEKQLSEMGRPSIGFSPTFVNSDPTHTNESRAALSAFQVDDFVRQVINNPLFQQILRDQGLRG